MAQAAIPGRFAVATVNHGLRPEAAAECAMVEEVCAARGIPCTTLTVTTAAGNLQAAAREARYAALAEWAGHFRRWRGEGRDVFAYFDNDIKGAAPLDAEQLKGLVDLDP